MTIRGFEFSSIRKFSVRYVAENDDWRVYEVAVTGDGPRKFRVEITAMQNDIEGRLAPEAKIEQWCRRNPLPNEGETIRIEHLQ